jgi:hypothetical protein
LEDEDADDEDADFNPREEEWPDFDLEPPEDSDVM